MILSKAGWKRKKVLLLTLLRSLCCYWLVAHHGDVRGLKCLSIAFLASVPLIAVPRFPNKEEWFFLPVLNSFLREEVIRKIWDPFLLLVEGSSPFSSPSRQPGMQKALLPFGSSSCCLQRRGPLRLGKEEGGGGRRLFWHALDPPSNVGSFQGLRNLK